MSARSKGGSFAHPNVEAPPSSVTRVGDWFIRADGLRMRRDAGVETLDIGRRGSMMIAGIASTPSVNSHKYALLSTGCTVQFPIALLSSHAAHGRLGEIVRVRKSATEIFVLAVLDDNDVGKLAWRAIEKSEEFRGFSAAMAPHDFNLQGEFDGRKIFDKWTLKEVSVCRRGACPWCLFEIYDGAADEEIIARLRARQMKEWRAAADKAAPDPKATFAKHLRALIELTPADRREGLGAELTRLFEANTD